MDSKPSRSEPGGWGGRARQWSATPEPGHQCQETSLAPEKHLHPRPPVTIQSTSVVPAAPSPHRASWKCWEASCVGAASQPVRQPTHSSVWLQRRYDTLGSQPVADNSNLGHPGGHHHVTDTKTELREGRRSPSHGQEQKTAHALDGTYTSPAQCHGCECNSRPH